MLFPGLQVKAMQLFCQEWQANTLKYQKVRKTPKAWKLLPSSLFLYFGQDRVCKKHKCLSLSWTSLGWFTGKEASRTEAELSLPSTGQWQLTTQTSATQSPDPKRWKSALLSEVIAQSLTPEMLCSERSERVKRSANFDNLPSTLQICTAALSLPLNVVFSILI